MHWSNWKLAARRVNENLLIHTARTINYHFVCGTAIRHVRDWIFPSVRSHHRCATSENRERLGGEKTGWKGTRTARSRNRCDFKRMR